MNEMTGKYILTAALFLCVLLPISLLEAAIGEWHNYTYSNNSTDMTGDGQTIWCATTGGLIKYDTDAGTIKKYLNSDGLGDINLLSVEIDSAGAVYAGGGNSTITKIDRDGDIEIYNFEGTTDIRYNILDMHADGEILWVATDIGVGKFLIYRDGGGFQDIADHLGYGIPLETPARALIIKDNYLWVGTDSGLAYIPDTTILLQDPANWNTITRDQNGLTEPGIHSLTANDDTLFVGTSNGVFWLDADSTWHGIGPSAGPVFSLKFLGGVLTAATNNGVYRRQAGNWELMLSDSLLSVRARGLAEDDQGRIWAAFTDGGFALFNDTYWEVLTVPGPASSYINDLAIDSLGNIWLAHTIPGFGGRMGISKFDGNNWVNYNYENSGIGTNGAVAVEYDVIHDLIWFGSWGDGLFSFDGDSVWQNFDETNSPLRGVESAPTYVPISDLDIDGQGNIWALNLKAFNPNVVMAVFDPDDSLWLAYYEDPLQIPDNFQHVIYVDNGITYVCGEIQNINRLDYGANPFIDTDDEWLDQIIGIDQIRDLQLDDYGKLFIASANGLAYASYIFNQFEIVPIELPDGHRSAVRSIALDGLGNKWVGTDSGVVELAGKMENDQPNWLAGYKTSNSFLLDNSIRSIVIDKITGMVYIATINGLSIYESGAVAPSPDLSDMVVYPNPVFAKDEDAQIRFQGVPTNSIIYIYTASGDLVKEIDYARINYWDLRNDENKKVAAGIYIFHVQAGELSGNGKFAIIR